MVAFSDFCPQDSVRVVGRRRPWRVVMLGVCGVIVDVFTSWQQPDRKRKVNRVLVVSRLEFDWGPKCLSPGPGLVQSISVHLWFYARSCDTCSTLLKTVQQVPILSFDPEH
eukprot:6191965-Pleurochrysis_carterae.AAC.1